MLEEKWENMILLAATTAAAHKRAALGRELTRLLSRTCCISEL